MIYEIIKFQIKVYHKRIEKSKNDIDGVSLDTILFIKSNNNIL